MNSKDRTHPLPELLEKIYDQGRKQGQVKLKTTNTTNCYTSTVLRLDFVMAERKILEWCAFFCNARAGAFYQISQITAPGTRYLAIMTYGMVFNEQKWILIKVSKFLEE